MASRGFDTARNALAKLNKIIKDNEGNTTDASEAAAELSAALEGIEDAAGGGGGSGGGGAAGAVEELNQELQETPQIVNDVANAWADFVVRGFSDFKGFVQSVIGSFKNMLREMIATAARNRIMISMGLTGGGVAGGVAQAAGMAGGPMGGIGGLLGSVGGIGSALIGGATNAIGAFTGGIGAGFSAIGAQLGAAATGSITAIAGAFGAVLGPLALVGGLIKGIIGSTKEIDRGLRVTVDEVGTLVETFRETERKRLFGLIKSRKTSVSEAGDDVANPITQAVDSIRGSTNAMAGVLGLGETAIDGFTAQFQVSLKGLSDEQAQQAVFQEFDKISDGMAQMALASGGLFVPMEGASARMQSLAVALESVDGVMRFLGRDMGAMFGLDKVAEFERVFGFISDTMTKLQSIRTFEMAQAAEQLIEFFGGLENLQQSHQGYFENFYSEQEQFELRMASMTRALSGLGVELPDTVAAFRQLVEAQDLTTEAGREAYASLVLLSAEFADLARITDAAAEAVERANEASTAAIAQERLGLERRILTMSGDTAALRALDLAAIDASNRSLLEHIFALEDQAAAARAAMEAARAQSAAALEAARAQDQIASERFGIETRLLSVQGETAALRQRELEALHPTNRALQEMVFALEDAQEVAYERFDLETRLLQAMGDTNALRARELAALDPVNRGLLQTIFRLEEMKTALDSINASDFGSRFEFDRARALAGNRIAANSNAPSSADIHADNLRLQEELENINRLMVQVVNNTGKTVKELEDQAEAAA